MSNEEHGIDEHGLSPDLSAALMRLERLMGTPPPTSTLRLWAAEILGEVITLERDWPDHALQLQRIRNEIDRNDPHRASRSQKLERRAAEVETAMHELEHRFERLARTREPDSPAEHAAAGNLRQEGLAWIVDARAMLREHEVWHDRSLQVDLGQAG